MAVARALVPESAEWWADRLHKQLIDRQAHLERMHAYYRGDHPLPWLPNQLKELAARILRMSRTNYMGLVVDSTVERMECLGFRISEPEQEPQADPTKKLRDDEGDAVKQPGDDTDHDSTDQETFRQWQANHLDAISSEAFKEAAISGTVYWLVGPNPDDEKTPRVTMEHPAQMIVEYAPGDVRQRDAALKVWHDDRKNLLMATLYTPAKIYKWQGKKNAKPDKWEPREGVDFAADNPYGVVPVVEMRFNAQTIFEDGKLTYCGVSEIADVIDVQDRINKTLADRLVTQDFGAFPQKWATGWAEDDDEADLAAQQEAQGLTPGSAHPASKVNFGRDRLVVATDKEVRFGEWASAPMDPYSNAKNEDVKDIAARTRTPSQYLLGEMVNISGEALQSAESGLVSKVKERSRGMGEALEELVRLMLKASGDKRDLTKLIIQTVWRDPEFRTIGQMADAVIKKHLAGLTSWAQTMEDAGYTPDQIRRNRREKRQDALADAALNFTGLGVAVAGQQQSKDAQQPVSNGPVDNPGDTVGIRRGATSQPQRQPGANPRAPSGAPNQTPRKATAPAR